MGVDDYPKEPLRDSLEVTPISLTLDEAKETVPLRHGRSCTNSTRF